MSKVISGVAPWAAHASGPEAVGCDLHALAGVQLHWLPAHLRAAFAAQRCGGDARPAAAAAPEPFDYVWAIDWDISWVGRLGPLLHAFDADASDLLTADPATQHFDNHSG